MAIKFNILKTTKIVLVCMLLTSFITHTIDVDASNVLISRMTISDIFGVFALGFSFLYVFKNKNEFQIIYKAIKLPLLVFLGMACSYFFSLNKKATFDELLITLYVILLSGALILAFKNSIFKQFFPILIITSFCTFFIGIYDLIASNLGWFTFFKNASQSIGQSGFRYFGQAANYSFTMLTLLIPLQFTKAIKKMPIFAKYMLPVTIGLGVVFLISTGRVSIISSFFIGVLLAVFLNYKHIKWHSAFMGFILVVLLGVLSYCVAPDMLDNLSYRFQSRVFNRVQGTPEADFLLTNFKDSMQAFKDNPLTGSGLGAFVGKYSDFEIHGTYLKFLGETGSIGFITYIIFMVYALVGIKNMLQNKNAVVSSYIKLFIPFLIASLLSWSYNYHFRKKEFWILYAVLYMLYILVKESKDYETKTH